MTRVGEHKTPDAFKIRSLGSLPLMVPTPHLRLIRCNLNDSSTPPCLLQFGNRGQFQNARVSLG
jgi:hypothetical protein